MCRLLRGGVDWKIAKLHTHILRTCRLLRGGVDWKDKSLEPARGGYCRLLRGGVDWKTWYNTVLRREDRVASFAEAWIEKIIQ